MGARPDRDELLLLKRERFSTEATEFRNLFAVLDLDQEHGITLAEFKEAMKNEYLVSYMASSGLALHDVELFFRCVAQEGESVDIDMFVEGCMVMKGPATRLDVQKTMFENRKIWRAIGELEKHV